MADKPLTPKEINDLKQLMYDLRDIQIPDVDKFVKALGGLANARKELDVLRRQFENIGGDVENIVEQLRNITSQIKQSNEGYKLATSSFSKLASIASRFKADQDGITQLTEKEIRSLRAKMGVERANLELSQRLNEERKQELDRIQQVGFLTQKEGIELRKVTEAIDQTREYLIDLEDGFEHLVATSGRRLTLENQIQKALGITGNLGIGLEKTLGKIGLGGLINIDDINEKMRLTAESASKTAIANGRNVGILDKTRVLASGIKASFSELTDLLDDPAVFLAGLAALVELGFKADKQTTDLAKAFLQNKAVAEQTREQFVQMSLSIDSTRDNTDALIVANLELNKQLGFNKVFSKDINATFVDLTQNMGLSVEAAGMLAKISITSGKTLKGIEQTIAGTVALMAHQNGIQLDGKEVFEDVGKITGQIQLNLKSNPSLIAAAVIQTKLLGTNLENVKKQSEFLLDFESSISAELKAELITGTQLNLEKARSFSLLGDLVGAAKELNNQGLTYNKYQQMNVIAQKSYAEALGLTADQLADQLLQQEAIGKSKQQIAQINGVEAANRLEQLDAQTKFNSAVEKLKDLLGNIVAGPVGDLLDGLSDLLSNTTLIKAAFGGIAALLVGKMALGLVSTIGQMGVLLGISSANAVANVASAEALSFGAATLPIIAGIGAVVGTIMALKSKSMNDGIVGPSGKILYTDKEGAIKLNDNDTVIAGTDLHNNDSIQHTESNSTVVNNKDSKSISNINIDMTPMIQAINDVRKAVDRLASKESGIYMDGKKIGSTLVQGSYKVA